MPRPATGQVVERKGKRGRTFALRFRAYGRRHYITTSATTPAEAEEELANVLADVRRGIWQPPVDEGPSEQAAAEEPTFHAFASEWLAMREQERLAPATLADYHWALEVHLLPFFARHRLSEITAREVDRYKTMKAAEGALSPGSINKTLTRLSQVLATAVDYDLLGANPAAGKKRRLKAPRPRRAFVEPEQLPTLLAVSEGLLAGRGRPLMATLAGAGLRIGEALALERRDVNLVRGELRVRDAKTEAGVRTVDLTPALRDTLALWLDRSPFKQPADPVFPTNRGTRDNRHGVRERVVKKAIELANPKLVELGIDPIGNVTPHGLRRTYASLRCAVGDDVAYTSAQLGHEDPTFTLKTYVHSVKRREKLTGAVRAEFDKAVEWARWADTAAPLGTSAQTTEAPVAPVENGSAPDRTPEAESV